MNPLRALADILTGRPAAAHIQPLDDIPAIGLPDWADRARLMRREGEDCHTPEHVHALQQMGHLVWQRDEAIRQRDQWEALAGQRQIDSEYWQARAQRAEARLRHPCTGEAA